MTIRKVTDPRPIGPLRQFGIAWRDKDDRIMYGAVVYATDRETLRKNWENELEDFRVEPGYYNGDVTYDD